ncbi:MAG: xanthine dehydrogenase family protein subunit M [Sphaerobacter sp.]|nr:xanthine dehydrogenase family protein subunit M [Sphaerobacter sp.]
MKPPSFDYFDPTTLDEAVALLAQHGSDAKVLAGGQSLVPMLNLRLARPAVLVDLNWVAGLDYVRAENGHVAVGALARQRAVERAAEVRQRQPLLGEAIRLIGHPAVRNRGTVVGSLAHADPAAELPAVAVALGAELVVAGPSGRRVVAADDFFVSYLTVDLAPDELLVEARFPALPARTGWAIAEVARRFGDFAVAGVVATLTLDAQGSATDARIGLFGVADRPLRATAAERALLGQPPDDARIAAATEAVRAALVDAPTDVHASGAYRRHVAGVLVGRALSEARQRAQAAG